MCYGEKLNVRFLFCGLSGRGGWAGWVGAAYLLPVYIRDKSIMQIRDTLHAEDDAYFFYSPNVFWLVGTLF